MNKCDQSKVPCSRCTRLQIACVGCGQQRYKFKNQSVVLTPVKLQANQATIHGISCAPSNRATMAASALLAMLEVTDIRFDLSFYGDFLKDIPRRLGTNEALDASVYALVTAFPWVHSRRQSTEMVNRYMRALKSLRVYLNDTDKAQSPNALCTIYLVMICQVGSGSMHMTKRRLTCIKGWIGKQDDHYPSHAEAIAHLLRATASQNWQDSFETEMRATLCAIVV
jgi:hypothetical protein